MKMEIDQLETPCVLVDIGIAEANIDKFHAYCDVLASNPGRILKHTNCHVLPIDRSRSAGLALPARKSARLR